MVILTDLVVFNFCTFHLKEKWTTMLTVERRLAVRQARFKSRLGTPVRFPHRTNSDEENGDSEDHFICDCDENWKKMFGISFVLYCLFVAKMEK